MGDEYDDDTCCCFNSIEASMNRANMGADGMAFLPRHFDIFASHGREGRGDMMT